MEDLYSVRTAASNFITTLCESKKAAGDHMEPLMGFLVGVLGQYHAQGGAAGADARTSRAMVRREDFSLIFVFRGRMC